MANYVWVVRRLGGMMGFNARYRNGHGWRDYMGILRA